MLLVDTNVLVDVLEDDRLGQHDLTADAADSLHRAGDELRARLRTAESSSAESRDLELTKAARDFEALFVSYLLMVMRETIEASFR